MQKSCQETVYLDSIPLSTAHIVNTFSTVCVLSLLPANHLQGWSRPAENPLPAYAGQTEEEDSEGATFEYTRHDVEPYCSTVPYRLNCIHNKMFSV